jgi:hypothetical protein
VLKQAKQTIYHSRLYPSHIVLPVIPAVEQHAMRDLTVSNAARKDAKASMGTRGFLSR